MKQISCFWNVFPLILLQKTMDVKVRNRKTKVVKTLPIGVYSSNKDKWDLIGEDDQPIVPIAPTIDVKKNELNESVIPVETGDTSQVFSVGSDEPAMTIIVTSDLHAEYERLSGTKPDKRWGIEKLQNKIEELKTVK